MNNIQNIERVPKGVSTFVYRINTASETFYMRFLPEDASFAAEVLTHRILLQNGALVPEVIGFEDKNRETGYSMMLTAEIPGASVEDDRPETNLREILMEAGRQLAIFHTIPVDGFGWIDRTSHDRLKGEDRTFSEYFAREDNAFRNNPEQFGFSSREIDSIEKILDEASSSLYVPDAVLVHGDFDVSHIFQNNRRYTGIIDLGEIRGNNRLYDLATFSLFDQSPDNIDFTCMLEGYRQEVPLTEDDLHGIELMLFFRALSGMTGTQERPRLAAFFTRKTREQLNKLCSG